MECMVIILILLFILSILMFFVPFAFRGRLEQINEGQHDHVTGKMHYVVSGGFRFTYIQKRHALVAVSTPLFIRMTLGMIQKKSASKCMLLFNDQVYSNRKRIISRF